MGFSVMGVSVVIFTGMIVSAGILYSSFDRWQNSYQDGMRGMEERGSSGEALTIEEVSYYPDYGTMNITIKNTGNSAVKGESIDIIIDGKLYPVDSLSVIGVKGTQIIAPGEEANIVVRGPEIPFYYSKSSQKMEIKSTTAEDVAVGNRIYVLDRGNITIFDRDGNHVGDIHPPSTARSISLWKDTLFVLDRNAIEEYSSNGTIVSSITQNITAKSQAVSVSSTGIYIANGTGGLVVLYPNGTYRATLKGEITNATSVWASDRIYVVDNDTRIVIFDSNLTYNLTISDSHMKEPVDVSASNISSLNFNVFVSDSGRILIYSPSGEYEGELSGFSADIGGTYPAESLYVADADNGLRVMSSGVNVELTGPSGMEDFFSI